MNALAQERAPPIPHQTGDRSMPQQMEVLRKVLPDPRRKAKNLHPLLLFAHPSCHQRPCYRNMKAAARWRGSVQAVREAQTSPATLKLLFGIRFSVCAPCNIDASEKPQKLPTSAPLSFSRNALVWSIAPTPPNRISQDL